jgi:hypothetical protein
LSIGRKQLANLLESFAYGRELWFAGAAYGDDDRRHYLFECEIVLSTANEEQAVCRAG